MTESGPLAGKVVVLTGASRGIGRALAQEIGRAGAQLVLIARTVGGLEEVDDDIRAGGGPPPVLVPHDLEEQDGLDQLGASLYQRFGKVDLLIGCAAELGVLSPLGHIKPKVWQKTFAVNTHANYRLLRSLDPLLRRAEAGQAIFLTDHQAQDPQAYWAPYAASKAALNALVTAYPAEVRRAGITVRLIFPPPTRTALRARAFPGNDPAALATPEDVARAIVKEIVAPRDADRLLCYITS